MKWTYEICKEEALKYKNRLELKVNNKPVFTKINREKWYELYNHMEYNKSKIYWTYNKCKEISLNFKTLNELKQFSETAVKIIRKNKWFELIAHLNSNIKHWTYEECKLETLKYKTKKELMMNNISIYEKIRREKWYELYNHMERIGNRNSRMIYVYEFTDNYCYIGLTYNLNKRNYSHYTKEKSPVYRHMKKTGLIPTLIKKTNYIEVNEASIMEGKIKDEYVNNNWNILNIAKTGNIGGNKLIWTYDKCKKEVIKYNNIYDLSVKSSGAYHSIINNKWHDLLESIYKIKPDGYWNDKNKCKIESLKYKNRTEFYKNNQSAYVYSKRNGWLNEFYGEIIYDKKLGERVSKPIIQYDLDLNKLNEFNSAKEASDILGIRSAGISAICNGYGITYKGYIFKHKNNA